MKKQEVKAPAKQATQPKVEPKVESKPEPKAEAASTEPKKLGSAAILSHLKEHGTIHSLNDNADTAEIQKLIEQGKIKNVKPNNGFLFKLA